MTWQQADKMHLWEVQFLYQYWHWSHEDFNAYSAARTENERIREADRRHAPAVPGRQNR